MIQQSTTPLEKLLRDCELDWMIDLYAPQDRAISELKDAIQEAALTEEHLAREYQTNPHKVRAFLQALATSRSEEMLKMVWSILQGDEIESVEVSYESRKSFRMRVVLRPSQSDAEGDHQEYSSKDINDAGLLRHFGIAKVEGQPLFDGFYPLHVK
jgi:hypothetical protein